LPPLVSVRSGLCRMRAFSFDTPASSVVESGTPECRCRCCSRKSHLWLAGVFSFPHKIPYDTISQQGGLERGCDVKILIIEDSETCAQLRQAQLESVWPEQKTEFIVVATLQLGIEKAESEKPDLAILDLLLPDSQNPENTLESFALVSSRIPTLVVTGVSVDDKLMTKAASCGVNCVIAKSDVTAALLRNAVELAKVKQEKEDSDKKMDELIKVIVE